MRVLVQLTHPEDPMENQHLWVEMDHRPLQGESFDYIDDGYFGYGVIAKVGHELKYFNKKMSYIMYIEVSLEEWGEEPDNTTIMK